MIIETLKQGRLKLRKKNFKIIINAIETKNRKSKDETNKHQ